MATPAEQAGEGASETSRETKATRERRLRAEHVLVGLLVAAFGGGGVKGIFSFGDLAAKVDLQTASAKELAEKIGDKLTELRLTLGEIKGHTEAGEKVSERLAVDLSHAHEQIRALEKVVERSSTRVDDHDRRLTAIEQGRH